MALHEINEHGQNEWDLSLADGEAQAVFFDGLLDWAAVSRENNRYAYYFEQGREIVYSRQYLAPYDIAA